MRLHLITAAALAAAAVLAGTGTGAAPLPGLQTGPAPWPAERFLLGARLTLIGLPPLRAEGQALHTHEHLDVFVRGTRVPVPGGIGFDAQLRFLAALHTHDATGVIHVESPAIRRYTLGQFFDVWGVRFTQRCIGGYCARGASRLRVYVNGRLAFGDPRRIALVSHLEIVAAYGTKRQLPRPVPRSYRFPEGY